MSLDNGWNLTDRQWRRIYLLERLYDRAGGKPDNYVTIDGADIGWPVTGDATCAAVLAETVQDLFQRRLATFFVLSGPLPNVPPRIRLTDAGAVEVEGIRRRRADPVGRRIAARDALLRWLYDREAAEIKDFWGSGYACFLSAEASFTTAEISDASRWLRDHGYASGDAGDDGGIVRMGLTPKGAQIVESGRSASKDQGSPGDRNVRVDNSPGAIVNIDSPGASQVSVVVTMTGEDQRRIGMVADYLEQVAPQLGLPENDAQRIPSLVTDLRAIAQQPAVEKGRLQRLLGSARELAIATAAVPLGAGLLALIEQAVHAMGLG